MSNERWERFMGEVDFTERRLKRLAAELKMHEVAEDPFNEAKLLVLVNKFKVKLGNAQDALGMARYRPSSENLQRAQLAKANKAAKVLAESMESIKALSHQLPMGLL